MSIFTSISDIKDTISSFQQSPYLNNGNTSSNTSTTNPCYEAQQALLGTLDTMSSSVISLVNGAVSTLLSPLSCVSGAIGSNNPVTDFQNSVMKGIGDLYQGNNSLFQSISNMSANLSNNSFCNELGNIQDAINNLINDITNASGSLNGLQTLLNDVTNAISDIGAAVNCIKSSIGNNFLDALNDANINNIKAPLLSQVQNWKQQAISPGVALQTGLSQVSQNLNFTNQISNFSNAFKTLSL